jgi:hypothetical protein
MKRVVMAAALLLLTVSPSRAAPLCTTDTLAAYLALAGGCEVAGLEVSGFSSIPVGGVGVAIDPTTIAVVPLLAPAPGLRFQLGPSGIAATGGQLFEALIGYIATGAISGNRLAIEGSNVTPDGAVSAAEDKCLDGMFDPSGPTGCTGSHRTLTAADLGFVAALSDAATFTPVSFVHVLTYIAVDGGAVGAASLAAVTNEFTTGTPSTAVPEPTSLVLTLVGLGALQISRHRRRR